MIAQAMPGDMQQSARIQASPPQQILAAPEAARQVHGSQPKVGDCLADSRLTVVDRCFAAQARSAPGNPLSGRHAGLLPQDRLGYHQTGDRMAHPHLMMNGTWH